ncbi:GNAT family N-acetyltransferase [Ornithinimicrobium pekingense]|uniref:N-acetyltransferase domain-containing protein n=1 Tax=Ornithinimicrobium pekingense TaxID=384677 RepID=A0ABQ2F589_9MICO|nr:GNAT family N-acetyltransferase [Ornithinimicrobium pekingense]GGK63250.1 hypothetical protein GCM10011509_09540 [Ornithinimicrobium pekingense]
MVSQSAPRFRYRVEPATASDGPALVEVLAESFQGYAWTSWIVPAEQHEERLGALFALTVSDVALPHGDVWVARGPEPEATVVGGVVVLRPDRPVPAHVWDAVGRAEAQVLGERLEVANQAEAACGVLRPTGPHLNVATMGVHPAHRRLGVARDLLKPVVALADRLGVTTYLETSSEANVALYRQAGFSVSGEVEVPGGGPYVWAMRRGARA